MLAFTAVLFTPANRNNRFCVNLFDYFAYKWHG